MRLFIFTFFITFIQLSCQTFQSDNNPTNNITDFASAKEVIPGQWVAKEQISDNWYQYDLLLFNKDGSLKFAQGASTDQAFRLANESTLIGKWTIIDNPNYLNNLISDKKFLLDINLEGVGTELFRVELDPSNKHRMGRDLNEDDMIREQEGLFSFGGKTFTKN